MLRSFRIIALLEGISYLLLFGIGMPLKYLAQIPEPNIYMGYAHGLLFILFVAVGLFFTIESKWGMKNFLISFVASLLPFGTFWLDKKYLKPLAEKA
jgi:integral membrane protein